MGVGAAYKTPRIKLGDSYINRCYICGGVVIKETGCILIKRLRRFDFCCFECLKTYVDMSRGQKTSYAKSRKLVDLFDEVNEI